MKTNKIQFFFCLRHCWQVLTFLKSPIKWLTFCQNSWTCYYFLRTEFTFLEFPINEYIANLHCTAPLLFALHPRRNPRGRSRRGLSGTQRSLPGSGAESRGRAPPRAGVASPPARPVPARRSPRGKPGQWHPHLRRWSSVGSLLWDLK